MSKVPYASAIRSLMYAMVCTRIGIAHVVGTYKQIYGQSKKIVLGGSQVDLRYLRGNSDMSLYLLMSRFEAVGLRGC
jgi:hypothetical protein